MSLHIWPVEELSQTKNKESVLKWTCVFNCSVSTSANDVVKPSAFAPLEIPTAPSEMLTVPPSEG